MPSAKLLLGALALSFFGSLVVAAMMFPPGYDWRHTVMSSLESPSENPEAFRIVSYGMAVSGILLALCGIHIHSALTPYAPKWIAWARVFFILGGILLTISALITPGHYTFLGLPKAHAKMAQAAGVGFVLGMILNLPAILATPTRRYGARGAALTLICLPLTVFLLSWVMMPMAFSLAPTSFQQDFEKSVFESLAFWEWVGSVSVYLFVVLLTIGWHEQKANK